MPPIALASKYGKSTRIARRNMRTKRSRLWRAAVRISCRIGQPPDYEL
ncbi:MAG: hypothetical protein NTV10_03395 [Methanoregula sp.]|nr:hypothetical protein [Methanoregula sp.]